MDMLNWNIIPNVSVNGIKFGTERHMLHEIIGKPVKIFKKSSDSMNTTDAYPGFHVYYTVDNKMEAIEFGDNNFRISIDSKLVFPGTVTELKKVLPDLEGEYGMLISNKDSIGICAEKQKIVSLLAGCKDYYNTVQG